VSWIIGLNYATKLLGSKFVYENKRQRSSNNYKFARSHGTLCVTDERIPSPAISAQNLKVKIKKVAKNRHF